jgi:monovalent cation/hydrogen antiporter
MNEVVIVLILLAAVAALVPLAEHFAIPYPIMLVIGGLALGLAPGLPDVRLEPHLVFLLFLPPLLYWEAVSTSWREFRADLRPITSLACGLVVFTTCGVAVVAHLAVGLPWGVGFVLGAVVSATDAVSATAVTARLGVPRRISTILAGESLVNDATALVVYSAAVAAVVDGRFSLAQASLKFVAVSLGGVGIGLAGGWTLTHLRRFIDDERVEGTVALLTPFAVYLPADFIGVSGVLAAVAAGLYVGQQAPVAVSSAVRLRAAAVWELGTFLLNGLVFILIGLEFRNALHHFGGLSPWTLTRDIAIVSAAVILVRLVWVFPANGALRLVNRYWHTGETPLPPAALSVIGWAGMRGVISLATVLALPDLTDHGPFPDRDFLLLLTVGVIAVTLVGQGLTLSPLIRLLGVTSDDSAAEEELLARRAAAEAARERLDLLALHQEVPQDLAQDLRSHLLRRLERLDSGAEQPVAHGLTVQQLRRDLLNVERHAVIDLRNRNAISDEVLRRVQRELDLEQVRLDAAGE